MAEHIEPTDNAVAKQMREIFCMSGAAFARPELEKGWREIWRLESEVATLRARVAELEQRDAAKDAHCQAELRRIGVEDNAGVLVNVHAEALQSRLTQLEGALRDRIHHFSTGHWYDRLVELITERNASPVVKQEGPKC